MNDSQKSGQIKELVLPNFIIIGAARAGTVSLFNHLKEHPDVYLPYVKETNFFYKDYKKGLDYYRKTFYSGWKGEKAVGDISPWYLSQPRVANNIHEAIPGVQIIVTLRDPVERTFSDYRGRVGRGDEKRSFQEAIESQIACIQKNDILADGSVINYVDRSLYAKHLQPYLELFQDIHFILFEEFVADPLKTVQSLFELFGVDSDFTPSDLGTTFNTAHRQPRSKILNRLLWDDNIKGKIKSVIPLPRNTLISIRRFFSKLNDKMLPREKVPENGRQILTDFFKHDTEKLTETLGNKIINKWNLYYNS